MKLGFRPRPGFVKPAVEFKPFRSLYSAPLRDPPLRARPHSVESTVVCCTWLTQEPQPSFRFSRQDTCCRARHAEHRRRVGWPYVPTVERRRRFIDTIPHWPQTSRAAGWMPPPSWHASSLSCNWSFTFGASQYLYKQSHPQCAVSFFWLTPFPCTDRPEILHARHKSVRLKIPRSAPPSEHAFARSPTKTAKRPKMRVGSDVFEPLPLRARPRR